MKSALFLVLLLAVAALTGCASVRGTAGASGDSVDLRGSAGLGLKF